MENWKRLTIYRFTCPLLSDFFKASETIHIVLATHVNDKNYAEINKDYTDTL